MSDNKEYLQLLAAKEKKHIPCGFVCENNWPWLYPFQSFCVKKALEYGRFALFEDCGLGKTRQQLTWANEVVRHTGNPVIIFAPLAVIGQTIAEGAAIGINVTEYNPDYPVISGIYITNYEQIDNIKTDLFSGIVLDESSIIKSFDGVYKEKLINGFKNTAYKLCCTATPSPNDPTELGSHSEFLGILQHNVMLAMFFVHDSGDTGVWRIKGHGKKRFWAWVSSWAIMLSKPSDIGFSDDGYALPPLEYIEKLIITPKKENAKLFNDNTVSATTHNAELRLTKIQRMDEVVNIVKESKESFIIWVKQNEEGETLRKMFAASGIDEKEYFEVTGSDTPEFKKEILLGFSKSNFRILITKIKIAGMGLNYQNCRNMIFASPDFSFEGLYQAIRREWRFGQKLTVNAYIISTDTMENIVVSLREKQRKFTEMQHEMQIAMSEIFKTDHLPAREIRIEKTENWTGYLGDCIQCVDQLADKSIGFSMFSPPFPELYVYSSEPEDLGNCKDYDEFNKFFSFIPPKLLRVMQPGRNVAIHCMDTPIMKGKEGFIGLRDWSGMLVKQMTDAGFIYHCRVTIWKDPVTEMQRTKALGLLHKQVKKDSSMSRVGMPDYLLVFRAPGNNENPVVNQDTNPTLPNYIPVAKWQQIASPVWMDVNQTKTLNGRKARENDDEKHICPLQLETIERATMLWTNHGDTCLSMFGGIGSESYTWVKMGRKAISFELKTSYFNESIKNIRDAEMDLKTPKLIFSEQIQEPVDDNDNDLILY